MKNKEFLNNKIELLNLDEIIIEKLNSIDICKVEDLWKCNRSYLKNNNFSNTDISQIKIRLQLIGLDLNKKIY